MNRQLFNEVTASGVVQTRRKKKSTLCGSFRSALSFLTRKNSAFQGVFLVLQELEIHLRPRWRPARRAKSYVTVSVREGRLGG